MLIVVFVGAAAITDQQTLESIETILCFVSPTLLPLPPIDCCVRSPPLEPAVVTDAKAVVLERQGMWCGGLAVTLERWRDRRKKP